MENLPLDISLHCDTEKRTFTLTYGDERWNFKTSHDAMRFIPGCIQVETKLTVFDAEGRVLTTATVYPAC